MKYETTLKDYITAGNSQESLALKLGCTQGAVQQWLANKKDIRLTVDGDSVTAYEIRPVPSRKKTNAA